MTNATKIMEIKSVMPCCPLCYSTNISASHYVIPGCEAVLICNNCVFLFGYKFNYDKDGFSEDKAC